LAGEHLNTMDLRITRAWAKATKMDVLSRTAQPASEHSHRPADSQVSVQRLAQQLGMLIGQGRLTAVAAWYNSIDGSTKAFRLVSSGIVKQVLRSSTFCEAYLDKYERFDYDHLCNSLRSIVEEINAPGLGSGEVSRNQLFSIAEVIDQLVSALLAPSTNALRRFRQSVSGSLVSLKKLRHEAINPAAFSLADTALQVFVQTAEAIDDYQPKSDGPVLDVIAANSDEARAKIELSRPTQWETPPLSIAPRTLPTHWERPSVEIVQKIAGDEAYPETFLANAAALGIVFTSEL
jgi:hypothetical protein